MRLRDIFRAGVFGLLPVMAAGCASKQASSRPPVAPSPAVPRTTGAAPADWSVSPEEKAVPNPLPASPDNMSRGQELFRRHCTACHGSSGRGDGPIAMQWARLPRDLTHPERQDRLTDGEIFAKISQGHRSGSDVIMPGLSNRLSADDRWRIVLHVRTLRAKTP
jgi:mono/diheme cytochrome c family protein